MKMPAPDSRVFNFSAGPAALPEEVLQQAAQEMTNWHAQGAGVMELSHRSEAFVSIAQQAEADLRELLSVPDDYAVLFLQGGASGQFGFVPLNLHNGAAAADYVNTGQWSKKAIAEASKYLTPNTVATGEQSGFCHIPDQAEWKTSDDAAYLHYTPNETIGGVEFGFVPDVSAAPLVADMSSTLLSRPIDVSRFGVIYAGAQKNIGPAGLTIVIVDRKLFGRADSTLPDAFNYELQDKADSMLNTPPTYAWYMAGLVFQHLKSLGGLEAMATINERKAQALYDVIDASDFYSNPVQKDCRSWMNVPFLCGDGSLDKAFLEGATEAGLHTLKGHRSVGGMRASIYNAMPEAGVSALIAYMQEFERTRA
jgi:phosphoserine aminotransferase